MTKPQRYLIAALILVFAHGLVCAQSPTKIISEEYAWQCLATLSKTFSAPIGFVRSNDDKKEACDIKTTSLTEGLDAFVKQNPQYTWSYGNGVAHVQPKDLQTNRLLNDALNLNVPSFSLKSYKKRIQLRSIVYDIPVLADFCSKNAILQDSLEIVMHFSRTNDKKLDIDLTNVKLVAILDQIATTSQSNGWLLSLSGGDTDKILTLNFF